MTTTVRENINVYQVYKILFYNYISLYSFYKLYTNDIVLNNAYTIPANIYFSIDLIKNIYDKNYTFVFHHITGLFFLNYQPIELYKILCKLVILSLTTEVSSVFLSLIHLNVKTKGVKALFLITFLYRFFMLYEFQLILREEKTTFTMYNYMNLYKVYWILYILFCIMHISWLFKMIKKYCKKKIIS